MTAELAIETKMRTTDLEIGGGPVTQLMEKLGQRVAIPLYQAHLAADDLDPEVPSISDEVLTKLHPRNASGINAFLYGRMFPGYTNGETTALYFGEAALRTTAHPLIWCVVAPFTLILVWIVLRRYGYATGTLIGVAIWRGSLGGIIDILPALTFQLAVFTMLAFFFKSEKFNGRQLWFADAEAITSA